MRCIAMRTKSKTRSLRNSGLCLHQLRHCLHIGASTVAAGARRCLPGLHLCRSGARASPKPVRAGWVERPTATLFTAPCTAAGLAYRCFWRGRHDHILHSTGLSHVCGLGMGSVAGRWLSAKAPPTRQARGSLLSAGHLGPRRSASELRRQRLQLLDSIFHRHKLPRTRNGESA